MRKKEDGSHREKIEYTELNKTVKKKKKKKTQTKITKETDRSC